MSTERPGLDASPNADQIAVWNDVLAAKFTRFRAVIAASGAVHGDIALRRHPVVAGQRVLDVGCGFGETSLALARAVGPRGAVLALDVCEPFLSEARAAARAARLGQVAFHLGDAQTERLAPQHDLVFSRFGAMFFQDPVAAFANLRGALRPDGRLLLIVWRRIDENEWAALPKRIALRYLPPLPQRVEPGPWPAPGPFSLSKADVVRGILEHAGWSDVALAPIDTQMTVGQTIDEAVALELALGPAGEILREAKEEGTEKRPAIERDLAAALAGRATPRGVCLAAASWCVTARR